jgi:hypothetical protein
LVTFLRWMKLPVCSRENHPPKSMESLHARSPRIETRNLASGYPKDSRKTKIALRSLSFPNLWAGHGKRPNNQQPTSNFEHPTVCASPSFGCWSFDVGSWMFPPVHGKIVRHGTDIALHGPRPPPIGWASQHTGETPARRPCHYGWPAVLVNMLTAVLIPAPLATSMTLTNWPTGAAVSARMATLTCGFLAALAFNSSSSFS